MRSFLFLFSGIFLGFWISWPGIVIPKKWKCFKNIITRSIEDKISFKAALAVSPNYLLKGKRNMASKFRIVSDACFR
tara:strand:+ start:917 stop:1147 length:231 start_codon:yes stop_codon:yes gene_type:complete